MNKIKIFLPIVFAISICSSESINISGTVNDSSGKGIAGAIVLLEKANISTKTDEFGVFTLTGTVGIKSKKNLSPMNLVCEPFIENSQINFNLAIKSVIDVAVYSVQGRLVSRIHESMDAGSHFLTLPMPGDGVYLWKIKIGNSEYLLKGKSLNHFSSGIPGITKGRSQGTNSKLAKISAKIDDVLSVSKGGFLDYRIIVLESAMEMPTIKMIVNEGNVTDIDGNVYQSVKIGGQVWTTENLRATKLNDNIPLNNPSYPPKYYYYENMNSKDSIKKFGALYNWYAINTKKLAPVGWHVPSDAEWDTLENYLVANNKKISKSLAARTDWLLTDTINGAVGNDLTLNNQSGFSALPGGFIHYYYNSAMHGYKGYFGMMGLFGIWWCSTDYDGANAYAYQIDYRSDSLEKFNHEKESGYSVRLIKDY